MAAVIKTNIGNINLEEFIPAETDKRGRDVLMFMMDRYPQTTSTKQIRDGLGDDYKLVGYIMRKLVKVGIINRIGKIDNYVTYEVAVNRNDQKLIRANINYANTYLTGR